MYNISIIGNDKKNIADLFGDKYSMTDDLTQTNVVFSDGRPVDESALNSKLIFAASGVTGDICSERGIVAFGEGSEGSDIVNDYASIVADIRDFIENGNIKNSANFPDVSLGSFGDDVCRIGILMYGIDDPILLAAMMFSGMGLKAVAGGLKGEYGYALASASEPISRVPHVDGVLKVRVLQDI